MTSGTETDETEALDPARRALDEARQLAAVGRVDRAVQIYRSIPDEHPSAWRARHELGVLFTTLGQHERALGELRAALTFDAENVEVMSYVGAALTGLGRYEEAEKVLKRAQLLEPEALGPRLRLGILYFRRGLYAQAEVELRWVCERDHEDGLAHYYRGEALNHLGKVEQAVEMLQRAIYLEPESAKAYHTLGILFDRKHMPEEAAEMHRRARELTRK